MAGIKPLDMAGNYNVGIGWELNRWLHSTIPPTFQIISADAIGKPQLGHEFAESDTGFSHSVQVISAMLNHPFSNKKAKLPPWAFGL
jgi:hypothetical protein